jgi:hypothetical protein
MAGVLKNGHFKNVQFRKGPMDFCKKGILDRNAVKSDFCLAKLAA